MKKTPAEIYDWINEMHSRMFRARHTWQHYKGGIYKVLGLIFDTNTEKLSVKYKRIDGPDYAPVIDDYIEYSRPIEEWFEDVVIDNSTNEIVPRFVPVRKVEQWLEYK